MTSRTCIDCGTPISKTSRGRCRSCARRALYADPAARARLSEAKKAALTDPVKRARVSVAASGNLRAFHRAGTFDWSAWHRERARKQMAWLPEDRREEYRRLRVEFGAAEARRMITEDIAAAERRRVAALSPLERQMERLANGGTLVRKFTPKRADHDFTLGGIAPEAM